jgi:hypothetical protein
MPESSVSRMEEVIRSGRFDKITVALARQLIDSDYSLERVPVNERFYFGCIRESGHYLWGNHRGQPYKDRGTWDIQRALTVKVGFDGIDGKLQPQRSQQRGEALLSHSWTGWTALGFWDRTVDTRPGSNSTFLCDQRLSFDEMLADAQEHWPTIFARLPFEIVDVTNA